MNPSVLFVGPLSGTSLHRHNAFQRLGYDVTTIEPRGLLPAGSWVDRIEWHLSPTLLGAIVERRLQRRLSPQDRFDLAFVDSGSLLTADGVRLLRRHCGHVVNFNHDDPFGPRDHTRFSAYRRAVPEYDLLVVVRAENIDEARMLGARGVMLHPRVADEVAHAPRNLSEAVIREWQSDVAFVGQWMPERGPFLVDLVKRGVSLALYGPGWHKAPEWPQLRAYRRAEFLDGDQYAFAVQCAHVSLGLVSKGNRDLHTTRSLEIPALKGLLCAERTTEHVEMYDEGVEAVFWSDSAECAAQCHALLADEDRRDRIAAGGHLRYLSNGHSSEHLLRNIVGALS